MKDSLVVQKQGLFYSPGNFYIDPLRPVPLALITHAHGDHARSGSGEYITSEKNAALLRRRVGSDAKITSYPYGEPFILNNSQISFHPAGHILGSSQIRCESNSYVTLISGDYKRQEDQTADPFETIPCDLFVTEATFGLPIYNWPTVETSTHEILKWWQQNANDGFASILFCYALGKAQRILQMIKNHLQTGPVYIHGSIQAFNTLYQEEGFDFSFATSPLDNPKNFDYSNALILAPPSTFRSVWMKRFLPCKTAFASGWSLVRGNRRRSGYDKGLVLSDHADWKDLLRTIEETKAKKVLVTHGYEQLLSRYLKEELGLDAKPLAGYGFIPNEEE